MSIGFLNNPKFAILKAILGSPDYVVMGVMECIWERCHANKNIKRDGILPQGWGATQIAALAGWDGEADRLMAALTDPAVNLITRISDGRYQIHDYADHVPDSVHKRWAREDQAAARRGTTADNGGRCPDNGGRCAPTIPYHTIPAKQQRPPKPPKGDVGAVPIPERLNTPAFLKAWADWLADRSQRRKTVTARAAALQLAKLEPIGPAEAVRWIENAIAQGWTGIFPPGKNSRSQARDYTPEYDRQPAGVKSWYEPIQQPINHNPGDAGGR